MCQHPPKTSTGGLTAAVPSTTCAAMGRTTPSSSSLNLAERTCIVACRNRREQVATHTHTHLRLIPFPSPLTLSPLLTCFTVA
ncbi:hypothetical protein P280DRAFT_467127 [Massarina eburnea CBS 473.64]|uniref:Uncharacterized protein n=1 Tax=Massarina eburnea CBS 473.64 TaxID=1395130 RepID=A0A6A6SA31_9PLEO|nr:hypothetical protein P280DRAFT_467127 [Massarina eburnea CBS 473.64]